MKFEQINRKFTETVAEWMAKGYIVNTATMSGSQGEIGKIDLTDGKEIIRVVLDNISKPWVAIGKREYSFDGVELAVGRITDKVQPNSHDTWGTAWTSNMEVLSSEIFYEIGRGKRDGSKWYGTKEEAMAQQDKHWSRYFNRKIEKHEDLPDAAFEIVLPFIRRQPRCKSVGLHEIEKVTKHRTESRTGHKFTKYVVTARGKSYTLQ